MDPGDPDDLFVALIVLDLDRPLHRERSVVLGDLVGLHKVRVEVVLPGKLGLLEHLHVEGFCHPETVLHCPRIQARECSGEAETGRAAVGVRVVVLVVG